MSWWPWWGTALALSLVPIAHWLLLGRMFAVSGRFTALNDALRARLDRRGERAAEGDGAPMTEEELVAAMREATAAAFGADAVSAPEPEPARPPSRAPQRAAQTPLTHALFLVALVAGGALGALSSGGPSPGFLAAMGEDFTRTFGTGAGGVAALFGGGLLVGFGTRMAGGCTSGHGLCGVSRFQPGSLAATAAFFGTGIVVSFLLAMIGSPS